MRFNSINELFRILDQSDWLANCGAPVSTAAVRQLADWNEVVSVIMDEYGRYYLLEESNLIRDAVSSKDMPAYRLWNENVENVRPEVEELVAQKTAAIPLPPIDRKCVIDHLNWIVVGAAIEIFYRKYSNRDFNQSLVGWLVDGHLGVAWEQGSYPQGRAVVY